MEKLLYFIVHLGIPLFILVALFRNQPKSKVGFFLGKIFQFSCLLFLFQWGQYPMVGSYYFRYAILVIVFLVFLIGWRKWTPALPLLPKTWKTWAISCLLILITPLLLYLNFQAFRGVQSYNETVTDLDFPLKQGTYYVSSGGTTAVANNHFRNYPNSQQYAIDINQINRLGSVSGNVISNSTDRHVIFGQAVYSPCSGVVRYSENDVPDNTATSMIVDHESGRGNYVDLECDGFIISMSHFMKGSVRVISGVRVERGQHLAQVGNSGFSQEPHLHIQAARYAADSTLIGVPVTFEDRWLVRNDLVVKKSGQ